MTLEPHRVTTVNGRKVLFQIPFTKNCMVIAILNAVLQDRHIPNYNLEQLENKYNKKYNINERGLDITVAGAIAYDLGYYSSIDKSATFSSAYKSYLSGHKIIRIYGYMPGDGFWDDETEETKHITREYHKMFSIEKSFTETTMPSCHAVFVHEINPDGLCLFTNYVNGVNVIKRWDSVGLLRKGPQYAASGLELIMTLQRK
jgi:hypothetical protein